MIVHPLVLAWLSGVLTALGTVAVCGEWYLSASACFLTAALSGRWAERERIYEHMMQMGLRR